LAAVHPPERRTVRRHGIHRTYVSDIERGARNPTITVIEKLAIALGVKAGGATRYVLIAARLIGRDKF
jgi:transcriptional regulator with XRE-family HTH domain